MKMIVRCCLLGAMATCCSLGVILGNKPDAQLSEDDQAVGEVPRFAVPRVALAHQQLDQLIFGFNDYGPSVSLAACRERLGWELNERLDELQTEYKLDASQRRKLQLAGRGDIQHFFHQAAELHEQIGSVDLSKPLDREEFSEVQQAAMKLRQRRSAGLFDDDSLLSKILPKAVGPTFADQFATNQKRARDEKYKTYLAPSVENLMQFLTLRDDQKEKFLTLIRTEIPQPARINQYVYTFMIYHLSRLPDEKLREVLDEVQIKKFGQIKANASRYKQSLRNYGLLPDELDEERQEDSP